MWELHEHAAGRRYSGVRDALTLLLEDEGQEALTPLAACAALPDVIVRDLAMPITNNREFRAAQQQDARFAAIPVVVLSADRGVAQKAHGMMAHAFLSKPVMIEELLSILEHGIGAASAQARRR